MRSPKLTIAGPWRHSCPLKGKPHGELFSASLANGKGERTQWDYGYPFCSSLYTANMLSVHKIVRVICYSLSATALKLHQALHGIVAGCTLYARMSSFRFLNFPPMHDAYVSTSLSPFD